MKAGKSKVWQEVETNRMWREINYCDHADELSNNAWGHLKKIAKNMCSTDFRQEKPTLSALLNSLLYKDAGELNDKSIVEDELKSIMNLLYLIEKEYGGILDKYIKNLSVNKSFIF